MNNKEGNNKKSGARPTSSRPSSNKPKPAMQGHKGQKKYTKVAEVVSDKVEKKQAPKRPKVKDEIRLNKYIANSGACSRRDADIYIQSGNVKVKFLLLKWAIWLR
jgi:23S rRNA pseudouridine2605 synthase